MGFFAGSESLVANNLMSLAKFVTDPECRQYMARQMYKECLHNHTIVYICDSLGLDINEVYEAYSNVRSIKENDKVEDSIYRGISFRKFNRKFTLADDVVVNDAKLENGRMEVLQELEDRWIKTNVMFVAVERFLPQTETGQSPMLLEYYQYCEKKLYNGTSV